jgi:hypothetical protein
MIFKDTSFMAAVDDPAAADEEPADPPAADAAADPPGADVAPVPELLLLVPHAVIERATTTVVAPIRAMLTMTVRSVRW